MSFFENYTDISAMQRRTLKRKIDHIAYLEQKAKNPSYQADKGDVLIFLVRLHATKTLLLGHPVKIVPIPAGLVLTEKQKVLFDEFIDSMKYRNAKLFNRADYNFGLYRYEKWLQRVDSGAKPYTELGQGIQA